MHPKRVSQRVTPIPPPTHTLFGMEVSQASRLVCVCVFGCGWVCAHIYYDLLGVCHYDAFYVAHRETFRAASERVRCA